MTQYEESARQTPNIAVSETVQVQSTHHRRGPRLRMSLAAADQYSQIRTPAGARKLVCNFPAVPPPAQPTLSPAQLTVNYDFPAAAAARW